MNNLPHAQWFDELFALNKITRYIATLKASDGGYIRLPQPIELQAGDEVEWIGQMDSSADGSRFLFDGASPSDRCYVGLYTDGKIGYNNTTTTAHKLDGVSFPQSSILPNDSAVHSVKLTVLTTCYIGNICAAYNGAGSTDQAFLGLIVRRNGNVIHNISTDVAKGTTIIPNLAQPLGVELYSDNPFGVANAGTLTKLADGSWALQYEGGHPNNVANGARILNFPVTPNKSYLFKVEASEDINLAIYNSSYGLISSGVNEVLFTTTQNVVLLYVAPRTPNDIIFKKPSIKEAPHWAEYINVTDDNKERYTFDSERNAWVGENLLPNDFSDATWVYSEGWQKVNDNLAQIPDIGSRLIYIPIKRPSKYLVRVRGTNNTLRHYDGSAYGTGLENDKLHTITNANASYKFFTLNNATFPEQLVQAEMFSLLEVAQ